LRKPRAAPSRSPARRVGRLRKGRPQRGTLGPQPCEVYSRQGGLLREHTTDS
jgi:hypothetical protein